MNPNPQYLLIDDEGDAIYSNAGDFIFSCVESAKQCLEEDGAQDLSYPVKLVQVLGVYRPSVKFEPAT